jgi:hypothetical protein
MLKLHSLNVFCACKIGVYSIVHICPFACVNNTLAMVFFIKKKLLDAQPFADITNCVDDDKLKIRLMVASFLSCSYHLHYLLQTSLDQ